MKPSLRKCCLVFFVSVSAMLSGQAQVSITNTSLTYTQNFDGIDQSLLNLPPGWLFSSTGAYALRRATSSASLTSSTVGGSFLFVVGGTDEAIGILNGTSANDLPNGQTISFTFTNNTGKYITALGIGFNYEKYRNAPRSWTWRVTSTGTTGTISALSLAYGADGNSDNNFPPLQTPVSGNISGLAIADGSTYTITWTLTGASGTGNGQALAIDDFTMTATTQTLTTSSTDYFRSKQDGNWGSTSSWQSSSNGSNTWINATQTPGATAAGTSIQGGNTITVASNVTGNLIAVSGGATLVVNSGVNLTINNGPGTDLDIFGTVNNSGTITPNSASIIVESGGGVFNCLSTSSTTTGAIGNTGSGSVTGNVTMQQRLSAQRAYRLLGHPFNSNIALSSLQPYVDITGSGTGLTPGSASAFNYLTGAWSAYTGNTQTWNKNEALLLFVRGVPGEGIGVTNGSYSPSAPTISLTGTVNTGSFNYLVKAASSFSNGGALGWNAIGNPYPAPIDVNSIGGITNPGGTGASIYVWNATKGSTGSGTASGGYDFYTLGSSIIVPIYGAFFIKNTSGLDQFINFTESNKNTSTTPLSLLRTNTVKEGFDLVIADNAIYWDRLRINLDNTALVTSADRTDLDKFSNTNLDFYSISSDNNKLAINSRPQFQSETDAIALGLKTNQTRTFIVSADNVNLSSADYDLYLHDKYASQSVKIVPGMSYSFDVTADTATQGENRFEVIAKKTAAPIIAPTATKITFGPNPVVSQLNISSTGNTTVRIMTALGQVIKTVKSTNQTIQIPVSNLSKGLYIVEVKNDTESVTQQITKQ